MRRLSQLRVMTWWLAALALPALGCHSSGGPAATGTGGTVGISGSGGAAGTPGAGGTVAGSGTGGATGGTGAAGAQGSSGGAAGSAAADPCTTAIFCDDFETYAAGQAPGGNWTKSTNLGAVAVDDTQAHSGKKSVKFTTQSSSGSKTAYIRLGNATGKTVFPAPGNSFYGRMMFRLESAPTASVHWTLLEGSGLVPGKTYHALYRYGGQLPVTQASTFVGSQLMANYETPDSYGGNGPSSDCWAHASKVVVPVAKWSCVEWQFDGANNTMRLWLDGAAVPSLTVAGVGQGCVNQPATFAWTAPTFDRLDLGWESYQADDARTVYIDDVVIATTKVGCPP
ncbi:MAG: hypothetical protein ACJ8F1_17740 [Polyangia bacterium]